MQKFMMTVIATAALSTVMCVPAFAQDASAQGSTQASTSAGQQGAQVSNSASGTANSTAQQGASSVSGTQSTSANQAMAAGKQGASASGAAAEQATLSAVLSKSVDAKKAKEGDQVVAKTTQDTTTSAGTKIPHNTKLIGHVTEAKAKGKGEAQSTLGFVFDKAVLKNGQEIPLHAVVQAVAAPQQVAMGAGADMSSDAGAGMGGQAAGPAMGGSRGNANGGLVGGAANTVGGATRGAVGAADSTLGGAANATGQAVGANGSAVLNSSSTGVVGLKNVQLQQETAGTAAATVGGGAGTVPVLTSTSGNVRLDSGTQLVLKSGSVSANASGSASTSQK